MTILLHSLSATLDEVSAAVVVMCEDGEILHTNRAASELLIEGWPIRESNGWLQASTKSANEALMHLARLAAEEARDSRGSHARHEICLAGGPRPGMHAVGTLRAILVPSEADEYRILIALFITCQGKSRGGSLAAIAESFSLTRGETRILHQLLECRSVSEIAETLAVSENTVKTHLQNIFTKTGTSRQTQLIKLVSELRAPLCNAEAPNGRMKGEQLRLARRQAWAVARVREAAAE